jgi:hypothetical protein
VFYVLLIFRNASRDDGCDNKRKQFSLFYFYFSFNHIILYSVKNVFFCMKAILYL